MNIERTNVVIANAGEAQRPRVGRFPAARGPGSVGRPVRRAGASASRRTGSLQPPSLPPSPSPAIARRCVPSGRHARGNRTMRALQRNCPSGYGRVPARRPAANACACAAALAPTAALSCAAPRVRLRERAPAGDGLGLGAGATSPALGARRRLPPAPRRPRSRICARGGHGRASPDSHAGGCRWAIRPMNRMPIATIQNAGHDLERGAADRQEDEEPLMIPTMPIQRVIRPTRMALIITTIMPTASDEPGDEGEVVDRQVCGALRQRAVDGVVGEVAARRRICASRSRRRSGGRR